MTKHKKKSPEGATYSSWQVLDAANSYYALSTVFTSSLPRNLLDVEKSITGMEGATASATNRILALELYLKAFLVGAEVSVPFEHDLKLLFDLLSKENREAIKTSFDERSKLDNGLNVAWAITLDFQLGTDWDAQPLPVKRTVPTDPTLSALLVRNRHGFVVSRYLFQNAKFDKVASYEYEYRRLAILCGILCEGLEGALPNRSPRYQRSHQF